MTRASLHQDTHLDTMCRTPVSAPATRRERQATRAGNTVPPSLRLPFTLAAVVLVACGCGGSHHTDRYAQATNVQEACCEHITGPARDACLQKIVRVSDPEVARTSTNQSTYACVVEHFTCDTQTGHATAASAQAQMDCIQDLP